MNQIPEHLLPGMRLQGKYGVDAGEEIVYDDELLVSVKSHKVCEGCAGRKLRRLCNEVRCAGVIWVTPAQAVAARLKNGGV